MIVHAFGLLIDYPHGKKRPVQQKKVIKRSILQQPHLLTVKVRRKWRSLSSCLDPADCLVHPARCSSQLSNTVLAQVHRISKRNNSHRCRDSRPSFDLAVRVITMALLPLHARFNLP